MYVLNLYKKYIIISKIVVFSLFTVLCLFIISPLALAHRVFLTAYVEGDAVFVESGFSDGTPCNNAKVEVFDPSDKKVLEGRTDENGKFSFRPPQKTDLRLVLDAGMGHRDEYTLSANELPDIADDPVTETEAMPATTAETRKPREDLQAVAQIDPKQIEWIVDRVVQKRLSPLIQLVAKSQRKTGASLTEIVSGIGYILGLVGIAMYFKSRKGDNS
jgi:nickel transport protein